MQTEQDLEKLVHAHTAALLRYCTGLLGVKPMPRTPCRKPSSRHGSSAVPCGATAPTTNARGSTASPTAPRWICCGQPRRAANYPTPEPREQDPGISDELRTALAALPPLDRALVLERVLDGLDYAALARIHGRPAAYLRTRYHRAKKQLASRLRGEHHDE